jgi:D-alanine-D-alanine ligase
MKVLVTYNQPPTQGDFQLCHAGVLDAVKDVVAALEHLGHQTSTLAIGQNIPAELTQLAHTPVDCVFNMCESILEQSSLTASFAAYLELLGIPFTGAHARALTITTDKQLAQAVLLTNNVPVPESWSFDTLRRLLALPVDDRPNMQFPVIIKPTGEDGSIGIEQDSIATNWAELEESLRNTAQRLGTTQLIAQRYIEGREFTVGFLGTQDPQVLPLAEMTFTGLQSDFRPILSYQMKWVMDSPERRAFRRICPPQISDQMSERIIAAARQAYLHCGLQGYGRIDVRWDTHEEKPYVIDVNANPDITDGQGFPVMAQINGISYHRLIASILDQALTDYSLATTAKAVS